MMKGSLQLQILQRALCLVLEISTDFFTRCLSSLFNRLLPPTSAIAMESKKRPREAADGGENGDGPWRLEPRRSSISEVAFDSPSKRLQMAQESSPPRRVMREELRDSSVNFAPPAGRYRLQFQNDLPDKLYTCDRIMARDNNKIQISILDTTTEKIVSTGPLSSVKVKVLVLHGDFYDDSKRSWTDKEFNQHIVIEREGQGPLLRGKWKIQLENGVGYLDDITFSDNSSRTRSKKFSLAVRIDGIEVAQEAISRPVRVIDRRAKSSEKHHPPLLTDEVWRLEKIRKDGPFHKRLEHAGILNVQQFLDELLNDVENLRSLLFDGKSTKKGISNRTWDAIVANAKECQSVAVQLREDTAIGDCNAPGEMVPPATTASFPSASAVHLGNLCSTALLHRTSTSGSRPPSYQNELEVNTNQLDISSVQQFAPSPILRYAQAVPSKINEHVYQNKPLLSGSGERLVEEHEIKAFTMELIGLQHWTSTFGNQPPSYQNELEVNTNEMDISSVQQFAPFPLSSDAQAVPSKISEHVYQKKTVPGGSEELLLEEDDVNDFITELLQPNITMMIVATSSRKWFKLTAVLKAWMHSRAVRRKAKS